MTAVASGYGEYFRVWEAASGRVVQKLSCGREGDLDAERIDCGVFSPDGKTLAGGGTNGDVHLWDVATWRITRSLAGHEGVVRRVAFAPDGKTLASGGDDGQVKLWDLASGHVIRQFPVIADASVFCLVFSPDGKTLVSGTLGSALRLWDVASGEEAWRLTHPAEAFDAVFSPDGKAIITASSDKIIRIWDVSGRGVRQTLQPTDAVCLACSPDGKTLAVGNQDSTLQVWDLESSRSVRSIKLPSSVNCVALLPGRAIHRFRWRRLLATLGRNQRS